MKKFYLFAAAAVLLTACVKTQNLDEAATIGAKETAVSFDVYTARATKAGKPQEITTAVLKEGPGFGVFAYYTDNGKYDQYVKPNFMYNQQVKWDKENKKWVYEPVKYWPNEVGNAAISDDNDYLTFFAYAPYVNANPISGAVKRPENAPENANVPSETELQQKNITGLINNNTVGNPKIKYVVDLNPATSVDLLWGVQSKGEQKGLPFLNQLKPKTADSTVFNLRHALAKLNVIIDAHGDGIHDLGKPIDENTRIYVRSITFEGFATKGALDLNNTFADTPLWMDYAGNDNLVAEPVTIFDGRKDGKEGHTDGEATREKVTGLNPVIVQSVPYSDTEHLTAGVTNTMVNLFEPISGMGDPIFVIPNGDAVSITIVYDVETKDKNLAGYLSDGVTHGSTIENTITKKIEVEVPNEESESLVLKAGKAYKITLHLGMTSVKVAATVAEWEDGAESWVDLPLNS